MKDSFSHLSYSDTTFFNVVYEFLTHEDLARGFCVLPPLEGLPSIFLYMACSAPLCSEFFFTSLESSA